MWMPFPLIMGEPKFDVCEYLNSISHLNWSLPSTTKFYKKKKNYLCYLCNLLNYNFTLSSTTMYESISTSITIYAAKKAFDRRSSCALLYIYLLYVHVRVNPWFRQ